MKKIFVVLSILMLACTWAVVSTAQQARGYVVVVNTSNDVPSISKDQVSQFLLKKKSRWPNGDSVDPVDQLGDSAVREAISRDLHGRSVASIKVYWQRQIFSGRNTPPPEVDDDGSVIDYVASRPGAIGYVSASTPLNGVKPLSVTE